MSIDEFLFCLCVRTPRSNINSHSKQLIVISNAKFECSKRPMESETFELCDRNDGRLIQSKSYFSSNRIYGVDAPVSLQIFYSFSNKEKCRRTLGDTEQANRRCSNMKNLEMHDDMRTQKEFLTWSYECPDFDTKTDPFSLTPTLSPPLISFTQPLKLIFQECNNRLPTHKSLTPSIDFNVLCLQFDQFPSHFCFPALTFWLWHWRRASITRGKVFPTEFSAFSQQHSSGGGGERLKTLKFNVDIVSSAKFKLKIREKTQKHKWG